MSSLLFQSTGKGGGSSSSSSSSSANPFMDLAHFYEQELSENNIDSNGISSRQFRQQNHRFDDRHSLQNNTRQHLFPSFSTSTDTSSSSVITSNTQGNVSYTQPQDEFKSFSHHHHHHEEPLPFQTFETFQIHSDHQQHFQGSSSGDMSEYLKRRQEYYFREAMARSQDRQDGLGPIVDFSQQLDTLVQNENFYPPPSKKRLEDHIEFRHHNPYADKQWNRTRASSQREQVMMDMGQSSDSNLSNDLDMAWQNATSASDQSNSRPTINSTSVSNHSVIPIHEQLRLRSQESMDMQAAAGNQGWAEEFERVKLTSGDQSFKNMNERRGSLKTCGFMLDPKISHDIGLVHPETLLDQSQTQQSQIPESRKVYNDDEFEGQMLQAWMETLAQERQEAIERVSEHNQEYSAGATHELQIDDGNETEILEAWTKSLEQEKNETDELIDEGIEKSILKSPDNPQEIYNDDVFESDMLQSWMETLALERQERAKSDKEEGKLTEVEGKGIDENTGKFIDEAEQKLILEMALRRLNGLMHQLGRRKVQ
ncbi:hypothetical protein BGZ76_004423 [Entomortierella beljakovae]|nr:hypothetical protein BGZ76_004423 [Entomortierella beljakovae]